MRAALLCSAMLVLAAAPGAAQERCGQGGTALVLSGGGAKGLAHIGVLRVLDSLGVHPDLIVGSSMGAIVGALYASGRSPREIDSLFRAAPEALFRSDTRQPLPRALGPLKPLIAWEETERGLELQRAALKDGAINAWLDAVLLPGNLAARGDFCRLRIPFYAVATDLARRTPVPIDRGDLAKAVRASMAIPLVFEPVREDGRTLADGGLSANTPAAVARRLGARRLIISEMYQRDEDSLDLASPITIASYLLTYLFRQPGDTAYPGDLLIRSDVTGIGNLDYSIAILDTATAHGARAALAAWRAVDSFPTGSPRVAPGSPVPVLAAVATPGLRSDDARDLLEQLSLRPGEPLDTAALRRGLLALATSDRYRAVWLRPDSTSTPDSLRVDLVVQKAPTRVAALGLAYDNELGARLWAGAVDGRLFDRAAEASAVGFVGGLDSRITFGLRRTWRDAALPRPALILTLADQRIRTFDAGGNELGRLETRQGVGFAGLERLVGRSWVVEAGLVGRIWEEPTASGQHSGGVRVRVVRADPDEGARFSLGVEWADRYRRAAVEWEEPVRWGRVTITPHLRAGIGDSLPLQLTFPLGGDAGFPGLHLYEVRGDREAFGSVAVAIPIVGELELRAEAATGQATFSASEMTLDHWQLGGRVGLGISTPLGPARLEYGVTRGFRNQVLLRVGRWF